MPIDSIPKRLFDRAKATPSRAGYLVKDGGVWKATDWAGYAKEVMQAARALVALGFQPGQRVCILGFNRPEWVILDHAAMMAGGAAAGIYTTCSAEEVQYIVHHSESLVVLVEDAAQYAKIQAKRAQMPLCKTIVMMRGGTATGSDVLTWEDFLAKAEGTPESVLDQRIDAIEQADLATLIYTSGTTGPPKGVMLSHRNLAWTSDGAGKIIHDACADDSSLSYLPLSHIAEQMFSIHLPVNLGSQVYFAEDFAKVAGEVSEDVSTKATGGELGWFQRQSLANPEWEPIVFAMQKGDVRGPVTGPQGLHVFLATDVQTSNLKPFDQMKEQISRELRRKEMDKQTQVWLEELRKKAYIDIKLQ